MKLMKLLLFLLVVLLIQSFLEGLLYQSFLFIKNNKPFDLFLNHTIRYSLYRFSLTVLPYIITMLMAVKLKQPNIVSVGIINLLTNSLFVGFIWYLEASMFDDAVLFTTILAGLIMLLVLLSLRGVSIFSRLTGWPF